MGVVLALGACQSQAAIGASCARSSDCSAPLVCRIDRCRSECVENRDCPLGTDCLLDQSGLGACSVPADRGCGSGGSVCPAPLTCVNDHCVNTCTDVTQCPDDGQCLPVAGAGISFCFAPDRSDAGTPADAGSDTGSDADLDATTQSDAGDAGPFCASGTCTHSLCAGTWFACAIRTGGTVGCWGINAAGQLGDGTGPTTARAHGLDTGFDYSPMHVTVIDDAGDPIVAESIACAEQSACAILAGGSIVCWGGEGGMTNFLSGDPAVPTPARAHTTTFGAGFVQLVGGRYHYCASRGTSAADGVVCWGDSSHGEPGTGTSALGGIYTNAGTAWQDSQLAAGTSITCGLNHGVVSCAGLNDSGAAGPSATTFPGDQRVPIAVPLDPPGATATELVAGTVFACALLTDHTIECWGWASQFSLGYTLARTDDDCAGVPGADVSCSRSPTRIDAPGLSFAHLWSSGRTAFVCAQTDAGLTYCWGGGGLTGDCILVPGACLTPTRVPLFDHATEIALGADAACARFADRHIRCVGHDLWGQLGRGTTHATATDLFYDDVGVVGF